MNSNSNLNPLANHFRARNVSSDAKTGFAARSISGNNSNNANWNNAPENQMPITTSPTRPVQTPRMPPQQQTSPNYAQNGAMNTAPQLQPRPGQAGPVQTQQQPQYPAQQLGQQQLQPPPRPASSSPPSLNVNNNRTPSPNSTPPSQSSPSPSPQRPAHLSQPGHSQTPPQSVPYQQPPQQQYASQQPPQYASQQPQQQQQYAPQQQPRPHNASAYPPNNNTAHSAPNTVAPNHVNVAPQPSPQPIMTAMQQPAQLPQPHLQQQPINQTPTAMPIHEQTTQEDAQSIPDDMLMALDEAQTMLHEHQARDPVPHVNQPQQITVPVPVQQEHHVTPVTPSIAPQHQPAPMQSNQVTPVIHEPAPQHSVNTGVNEELERLRRKEEALQNQLKTVTNALTTTRTQFNSTHTKEQEMRREMQQLKEQLAWKDQELREVRMTQLEQTTVPSVPSTDTRMAESVEHEHVVYQVNTESDESEPHSLNDHSTHVLNLRMKVGTGNTQANNSTTVANKHSPNNLQQLQIQGTTASKNRSPTSSNSKSAKSSPTQPSTSSSSTKKATVPSKGHKRSRDEMSRGHEETDLTELGEAERLRLALYKARVRLHNIKKVVMTETEEKNQNAVNLDQLKAELLDCIQMQMTSQFDALKAEIANLAGPRAADDDVAEPPTKKRKISEQQAVPNEETEKLVESLRGQIEQLTKQHQSARDEAEKSRQECESLNHMLAELRHVREQEGQRMTKLSEDKTELVARVTDLETQLAQSNAAAESARDVEHLREQVQSLQEAVNKSRDEFAEQQARADSAERQKLATEQRATELEQLHQEEVIKSAKFQEDVVKLQQECDKLKLVCKQLYLQIKSNKTASTGSLNNSGNLATSSEGQTNTDA